MDVIGHIDSMIEKFKTQLMNSVRDGTLKI